MIQASCHPNRKAKAHGLCGSCYDRHLKANNPEYKQRQMSNTTIWARNNPEKMKAIYDRNQAKYKASPNYKLNQRNKALKKYGLNIERYAILLLSQNNECALCKRKQGKTNFHVDHLPGNDYTKVRGILCHQCNWYLGIIDADPTIIDRIIAYRSKYV